MLTVTVVAEREDLRGPRRAGEEFARHHRHECTGDLLHVISSVDHVTMRRCLRVTFTGGATENKEDKNLYKQVIRLL
jgi:hypothetical protein